MVMKLEVVVIPVSDVDRSKEFYGRLGWRLDADVTAGADFRLIQFTPPGSGCSVQFGTGVTTAAPGSARSLYLVVSDIEAAHDELVKSSVDVSDVFHCVTGLACRFGDSDTPGRAIGRAPEGQSYGSFVSFDDPDGNSWLLQEVTTRLPGRIDPEATSFASAKDLADAMRRAATAHAGHEARTGQADEKWPDWYAQYMLREQAGQELPS
jgi:catechol 2,3-dioxygenase-like lactoylglutathione lyase family enzyme